MLKESIARKFEFEIIDFVFTSSWSIVECAIDGFGLISYCYRFGNGIYMFQIGLKNRKSFTSWECQQ